MAETPTATPSFQRAQLLGYIALCLIWGSSWLGIRTVVQDVPPLEAAAIRFLAAGVLLLSVAGMQKRKWPRGERAWRAILVLSFTIMAVPYGLLFWAEQYVASSMTAILFSAMPLAVALLTPVMLGRTVPRSAVFALVVAFGGFLYLFYQTGLAASPAALWGRAAVLGAMLLSAWSAVYAKGRLQEVDAIVSTGLQLLFGGVALLCATWAFEDRRHAHWTRTSLAALAFLTVFASCAAFVIYYWLLKRMQPYQLSTTSMVVPVIAVLEGGLFAHESIPVSVLIVMAVVVVSVGSVLRRETASVDRQADILMLRGKAP
jgi:drug/metabolite transporter (DMT)-like permease